MLLDLTQPPPPPGPIHEVNQNFKKWLQTLAEKFGHVQVEQMSSRLSSTVPAIQDPSVADTSGRTTSAPALTTETVSVPRYSQLHHPRVQSKAKDAG